MENIQYMTDDDIRQMLLQLILPLTDEQCAEIRQELRERK